MSKADSLVQIWQEAWWKDTLGTGYNVVIFKFAQEHRQMNDFKRGRTK